MTKNVTNYTPGLKGINLDDGSTVWVEPGQTLDISDLKVKGALPDFGKAGDQAEKDADEVVALRARVTELEALLAGQGPEDVDLTKMTVPELKAFAEANGIDLGEATKKDDILAAIELAADDKA